MKIINYLVAIYFIIEKVSAFDIQIDVNEVPKYYTPLNDDLYIAGSFNNWNPKQFRLEKTSYNTYRTTLYLPNGNYEYKFTRGSWSTVETNLDGSNLQNRRLQVSNSNQRITIKISNWDDMKGTHTATGNVLCLDSYFPYKQFDRTKRIWIYLPPDYFTSNKNYSVMYMHDGHNVFDRYYTSFGNEWNVDETLERFAREGKEVSIVVAMETTGDNGQRDLELPAFPNRVRGGGRADLYGDFIVNDVKPYIDKNFRTRPEREHTAIMGSSLGGYCSIYVGLKYQHVFSKIGALSPAFWYNREIFKFVSQATIKYDDIRIYMVAGGKENNPNYVTDMIKMDEQLEELGFANHQSNIVFDGVHSETFWSPEFPRAYEYLFYNL